MYDIIMKSKKTEIDYRDFVRNENGELVHKSKIETRKVIK